MRIRREGIYIVLGLFLMAASLSVVAAKRTSGASLNLRLADEAQAAKIFQKDHKHNALAIKAKDADSLRKIKSLYDIRSVRPFKKDSRMFEITFAGDEKATYLDLKKRGLVTAVEPAYKLQKTVVPTDPLYSSMWAPSKINLPEAWALTAGSSSVKVAVVDTGIDYNHEDLAANIWTNSGEIPGNGLDDDNNGYVDDYHGFDFFNAVYNEATGTVTDDPDGPMDEDGHGTHVAGIIAAAANNGKGVAGVSWFSKLMALKFLGPDGGTTVDAANAIYYAADMGANIINCSWGGPDDSSVLKDAIDYAYAHNVLLVGAAGNGDENNNALNMDITPFYPAAYANIMAVGATDSNDQVASFSNYGSKVEVSAPGVSILSTVPGSIAPSGYAYMSGTSMATPQVAGLAALLLAKNPGWTNNQLRRSIKLVADDLGVAGFDPHYGYGRINALSSLSLTVPPPLPSSAAHTVLSLGQSSVAAGQGTLVDIVLKDDEDSLLSGHAIAITSSDSRDNIVQPGNSDTGGKAQGEISSNFAGVKTLTVRDTTDNVVLSGGLKVTFVAGPASQVTAIKNKEKLVAASASYLNLTVQAKDQYGNPVPGVQITVGGLREGIDSVSSTTDLLTDAVGIAVLSLKSTLSGDLSLSIGVGGQNTVLDVRVIKAGDLNDDGTVNIFDASMLMAGWEKSGPLLPDMNCDNIVNIYDASILMANWSR